MGIGHMVFSANPTTFSLPVLEFQGLNRTPHYCQGLNWTPIIGRGWTGHPIIIRPWIGLSIIGRGWTGHPIIGGVEDQHLHPIIGKGQTVLNAVSWRLNSDGEDDEDDRWLQRPSLCEHWRRRAALTRREFLPSSCRRNTPDWGNKCQKAFSSRSPFLAEFRFESDIIFIFISFFRNVRPN